MTGGGALYDLLAPVEDLSYDWQDPAGQGEPVLLTAPGGWHVYASVNGRAYQDHEEELLAFRADDGRRLIVAADGGTVVSPFNFEEAMSNLLRERWRGTEKVRALSPGQLDLFYRVKRAIPRSAQLAARRALIRWQGRPSFPTWPLDDSAVGLLQLYGRCLCRQNNVTELRFRWFWPRGRQAAAILTHDVESAAGLRNASRVADLEEARGLRSSFNVVADDYPVDTGVLRDLDRRGFEVGVHGVHHDRSLFSSRAEFERQLPRIARAAEELGACGFRSPATHRVIDWLCELPVDYDCTVPHSDPYEPQPGGCATIWPYFLGGLLEIPYTMPQDHTVSTLLGEGSIATWEAQVRRLIARNGLIQCVTHPDPGYLGDRSNEARYVELLDLLSSLGGIWHALPRELSAWWRRRTQLPVDDQELATGLLRAEAPGQETELLVLTGFQ